MDADHHGEWTQIIGDKASKFQTAKVTLKVILKVISNSAIQHCSESCDLFKFWETSDNISKGGAN